jgi:hypothetical protein
MDIIAIKNIVKITVKEMESVKMMANVNVKKAFLKKTVLKVNFNFNYIKLNSFF